MQMNPCPFCGERSRLGVVTKWLRIIDSCGARRGAYARCKACNARGSLVSLEGEYDMRNEYPTPLKNQALIEKAITAWNGVADTITRKAVAGLPLFRGGEK